MVTTSITIRMNENLKKQTECIFEKIGLNRITAFIIFIKAIIREQKIPFQISFPPFYSAENQPY